MYSFINNLPTIKDMKFFNMQENINENFISYKINPNELSLEEKKLFITKYKLDDKAYIYKDLIFLSLPTSISNNN